MQPAEYPGNVSRETFSELKHYADLLVKWNARINLVGPSTIPQLWSRHIVDSAQVFDLVPEGTRKLVDLGSGAGLPGLIVAILAKSSAPELECTLVESDQRKATFLRTAVRELGVNARVCAERIESLTPQSAGCVTARALAPLSDLLAFLERHGDEQAVGLFPKGARVDAEIAQALEAWRFTCEKVPSATSVESFVLKVGEVRRA